MGRGSGETKGPSLRQLASRGAGLPLTTWEPFGILIRNRDDGTSPIGR